MEKNNICVYTCMTGNYDVINEIETKEPGIDYFLFTNNKELKSNTWEVVYLDSDLDNQHLARKTKILGNERINGKYDTYVWMDASIRFTKKIKDFIKKFYTEKDNFVTIKHHSRNTIEEEAYECIRKGKDSKEVILKELAFLKKEQYPQDFGLNETTVLIRKDITYIKDAMELWYKTLETYSIRDQLSCMYALWKTKQNFKLIELNVWNNDWFTFVPHNNYSKEIKKYRLYFDNEESYDVNNDFQGEFVKNENHYTVKHKIPINTKKTVLELSRKPFVIIKSIKIDDKEEKIRYFNTVEIKSGQFVINENGAFEFYKKLKKNDRLKIEVEIVEATDMEKTEAFNNLVKERDLNASRINELNAEIEILNTQLENLKNQKIMKLANLLHKMKNK